MTPFSQKQENGSQMPVPCGECPQCRKRHINSWSFRLYQQLKASREAHFLTLTYDDKHIPFSPGLLPSLDKTHMQLFIKRLRKAHPKENRLKYYGVGEYGNQSARPHYHILLFDGDIHKIDPAWQMGNIHYGQVSGASIAYTLKYVTKTKLQRLGAWIYGDADDDRQPPKSLMSKGIGKNYLTKDMVNWHKKDVLNRAYCNIEGGKKISMPRYYKDKIYEWWERNMIAEQVVKQMDALTKLHQDDDNFFINQDAGYKAAFYKMQKTATKREKV